jgi:hypothetical protein
MKLYHFTSHRHLYGIARHGLTVGDVPTDIHLNKGRCGVWLTSDEHPYGHGLGGAADKTQYRLTVNAPENSGLVRWTEWAPKNATPETIRLCHATASRFQSWYIYFGVIDRSAIAECVDMRTGQAVENWADRSPSPMDVEPVPADRRDRWHKKLLKKMARTIAHARWQSGGNSGRDRH